MKEPCPQSSSTMTCQTMSSLSLPCTSPSHSQTALLHPAAVIYAGALLSPSQLPLTTVPSFAESLLTYSDYSPVSLHGLPAMTTLTLTFPQLTNLVYLPAPQPITALHPAPLPTAPQPTRAQLTQHPNPVANPLLSLSWEEASGYALRPNRLL